MHRTTLALPDDLAQRFEQLAQATGTSPEAVMQAALEAFFAPTVEDTARLAAAIAAADRGEVVDSDEADAEIEALLLARGVTAEQLASFGHEARAEAEAFYGVSLS